LKQAIENIGILGAGTMGTGIAQVMALAGFSVKLYDIKPEALTPANEKIQRDLEKGVSRNKFAKAAMETALENIELVSNIKEIVADVVIEAVVEDLDVKRRLFALMEEINQSDSILATNTSSIPVTKIAAGLRHPSRVVGFHFFNPAHIMPLVEVIKGARTDESTVEKTLWLAKTIGKQPVVAMDSPGFIVNRVARHFYLESLLALEEGVADPATIDRIMESNGFRMGPFRLMALIGVDTNHEVSKSLFDGFFYAERFRPSRIQQKMVESGLLGKKTGKGFYEYD